MKYTIQEVEKHNSRADCWMIIRKKVYNVTTFLMDHPGGEDVLIEYAGKDATEAFDDINHSEDAVGYLLEFLVGDLE